MSIGGRSLGPRREPVGQWFWRSCSQVYQIEAPSCDLLFLWRQATHGMSKLSV